MFEAAFGSLTAERVLLFLQRYDEAYGRQVAMALDMPVSEVQKQLRKFENGSLVVSRTVGRTRVFSWNPRNVFVPALRQLLQVLLENLPPEQRGPYADGRRRPRRSGKPG